MIIHGALHPRGEIKSYMYQEKKVKEHTPGNRIEKKNKCMEILSNKLGNCTGENLDACTNGKSQERN